MIKNTLPLLWSTVSEGSATMWSLYATLRWASSLWSWQAALHWLPRTLCAPAPTETRWDPNSSLKAVVQRILAESAYRTVEYWGGLWRGRLCPPIIIYRLILMHSWTVSDIHPQRSKHFNQTKKRKWWKRTQRKITLMKFRLNGTLSGLIWSWHETVRATKCCDTFGFHAHARWESAALSGKWLRSLFFTTQYHETCRE